MKRIMLVIKGLGRGGAEQLLVSTVRHADRSRFAFRVVYLLPWKDALVADLEAEGAAVRCLDSAKGAGWIGRLRSAARDADLVHVHSPYPAIGARLGLPRRMPLVYTEHNEWQRYHPATFWGNAITYPRNDHVFAVSDTVRATIRYPRALRFRRVPPMETLVHGPDPDVLARSDGVDGVRAELGLSDGEPLVGTVANLKAHKGIEHLLAATPIVRRTFPRMRVVVVGQGPLEAELRARTHALGLDDVVVFTGFRTDATRLARAFDVFVLPSLGEGLPIALLEAMSLGRPSVVTSVSGLPTIVQDGAQGAVVPPADPAALATAIERLLADPDLRIRYGDAARVRSAAFDIRRAVRRMEEVWEALAR